MSVVTTLKVNPIEDLGWVLHQSIIGDKIISDLFHFLHTLKKMQDQGFIKSFVKMPPEGGIWFLKMNEIRYKKIQGKWRTQNPYNVSDNRIDLLYQNIRIFDHWDQEKKQAAKTHYKNFHGIVTKTIRNIQVHKPAKKIPYSNNGENT